VILKQNLLRFLLVLWINFQLLEKRQCLTKSMTVPSRAKFLAVLLVTRVVVNKPNSKKPTRFFLKAHLKKPTKKPTFYFLFEKIY